MPVRMVPNTSEQITGHVNNVGDNHVDDDGEPAVKYGIKASLSG